VYACQGVYKQCVGQHGKRAAVSVPCGVSGGCSCSSCHYLPANAAKMDCLYLLCSCECSVIFLDELHHLRQSSISDTQTTATGGVGCWRLPTCSVERASYLLRSFSSFSLHLRLQYNRVSARFAARIDTPHYVHRGSSATLYICAAASRCGRARGVMEVVRAHRSLASRLHDGVSALSTKVLRAKRSRSPV
jgi:hypothetical protein